MSSSIGRSGRGRRDNGLDAADYVPLVDLDSRVGEEFLDALGLAGIAAYLQPTVSSSEESTTPLVDQLWVDRDHADDARQMLTALELDSDEFDTVEPDDLDIEAAWEQIVAGFHTTSDVSDPPWPSAETDTGRDTPAREQEDLGDSGSTYERPKLAQAPRPLAGPRDVGEDHPSLLDGVGATDDEGYVPPPPPPIPRPSRHSLLAIVVILIGVFLVFQPTVLGISENMGRILGGAGILTGAVALVFRLRDGFSSDDDDPDDGAVV